jgi:hypothetical protein
MLKERED